MEKNCKTCGHQNEEICNTCPDISPDLCCGMYTLPAEKVERFEKVTSCIGKNVTEIKIGDTVYHRSIYEHKEPLKVVGIIENSLLLEGDFSGGTHNVIQRDWLPLKGTSRVYNHAYKERVRKDAVTIKTLAIPCKSQDNAFKCMIDMADAVLVLTSDVQLNPEF